MNSENDLIQKLMISKKIMERHREMPRNQSGSNMVNINPEVESFQPPAASYNIPQEMLMESQPQSQQMMTQQPKVSTKDKILSSKLPDEIKRLMIEHPIAQPTQNQTTVLSNEIVEKATRLMNVDASGKQIKSNVTQQPQKQRIVENTSIDMNSIKDLIRETIEEVLSENNLLVESETNSKDLFTFRVGKHIFEGKVSKIKKLKG